MSEGRKEASEGRSLFKNFDPPMKGTEKKPSHLPETPRSSRMDEALRLREALQESSSCLNRRHLINELKSPKTDQGVENRFDDTDEEGYDEEFDVASIAGEKKRVGQNEHPILGAGKSSARSAILARLDLKATTTSPRNRTDGNSISSKVFKDKLSARFKSTAQPVRKMASSDSTEGPL